MYCVISVAGFGVLLSEVADRAGSHIFLLGLFLPIPRLAWHNGSWQSDMTFHKLTRFKTVRETGRTRRVRGL